MNESPLLAAAARTAPAGEHSTPDWTPGARTGKRQDPQTNALGWGRRGGVPKRAAERVCGEGATVSEQTPILTRTLCGLREALKQRPSQRAGHCPGAQGAPRPGLL